MIQTLAGESTITAYAAVRPQLVAPLRIAFADTGAGKTSIVFKSVSSAYFDVLGIPIVRGRAFTDFERRQRLRHQQHAIYVAKEAAVFSSSRTRFARGGPARHLHLDQEEWFYALEGEFAIEIGRQRLPLGPR